jgi:hypothetical protein
MTDARRHRAHAGGPPSIIFVPLPVAGSPKTLREVKPGSYPSNQRQPWRPQQAIPHRASKAERTVRFLDGIARQDADIRQFMKEARHAN